MSPARNFTVNRFGADRGMTRARCIRSAGACITAAVLLIAASAAAYAQVPQRHQLGTLEKFEPGYALPQGVSVRSDLVYASPGGRDLHLDLFLPEASEGPLPVVVFVQGSGYNGNNKVHFWREAAELARRGFAGVTIEHRGAVQDSARWPAQLEDAEAALDWISSHGRSLSFDPARVVAVGISSGAHIAAMLASVRAGSRPRVRGAVLINGPLDLAYFGENRVRSADYGVWLDTEVFAPLLGAAHGDAPEAWLRASPATHLHAGNAPVLIIHGTADGTLPIQQSRRYYDAARAAGAAAEFVEVQDGGHEMTNAFAFSRVLELTAGFVQGVGAGAGGTPVSAEHAR
jgi:acetyl esterase/lipase